MYKTVKVDSEGFEKKNYTYILSDEPIKSGDVVMISVESDPNYGYVVVIGGENTDIYSKVVSTNHPDYQSKVPTIESFLEILENKSHKFYDFIEKKRDDWFRKWMAEHSNEGVTKEYMDYMASFNEIHSELFKVSSNMDCTIRMNQTYKLEPHDKIGDLFTLKHFVGNCECGGFINYDGFGYYATKTEQSNIEVYPSDIKKGIYRTDFTHVKWYNR